MYESRSAAAGEARELPVGVLAGMPGARGLAGQVRVDAEGGGGGGVVGLAGDEGDVSGVVRLR